MSSSSASRAFSSATEEGSGTSSRTWLAHGCTTSEVTSPSPVPASGPAPHPPQTGIGTAKKAAGSTSGHLPHTFPATLVVFGFSSSGRNGDVLPRQAAPGNGGGSRGHEAGTAHSLYRSVNAGHPSDGRYGLQEGQIGAS